MAKIEIIIGHDIRAWSTFTVNDVTDEERAVLADENDEEMALALLGTIYKAGRAAVTQDDTDDDPTYFADPAIISIIIHHDGEELANKGEKP